MPLNKETKPRNLKSHWFYVSLMNIEKSVVFILSLASLFNGISTFLGYLIPKPPLWKRQQ